MSYGDQPSFQNISPVIIYYLKVNKKNPVKKLQISFLQHILGVNTFSNNWTFLSETYRNRIISKITSKIVKCYVENIIDLPSPILQAVLDTNKQMPKEGITSWFTTFRNIWK